WGGAGTCYDVEECENGAQVINAMIEANKLKTNGAHLFMLGIGTITATNLTKISGTTLYDSNNASHTIGNTDYATGSFSQLEDNLTAFVARLCPSVTCTPATTCPNSNNGSVEVNVSISGEYSWEVYDANN